MTDAEKMFLAGVVPPSAEVAVDYLERLKDARDSISSDMFSDKMARNLYELCLRCLSITRGPLTEPILVDLMNRSSVPMELQAEYQLTFQEARDSSVESSDFEYSCATIKEEAKKLWISSALSDASLAVDGTYSERRGHTYAGVDGARSLLMARLFEMDRRFETTKVLSNLASDAPEIVEEYAEAKAYKEAGRPRNLLTGIGALDNLTGGAVKGEFWLLSGWTGEGKSASVSMFPVVGYTMGDLIDKRVSVSAMCKGGFVPRSTVVKKTGRGIVYRYRTVNGTILELTSDHRVYDGLKFVPIRNCRWICKPEKLQLTVDSVRVPKEEPRLVGMLLGDGSLRKRQMTLCIDQKDHSLGERFVELAREYGDKFVVKRRHVWISYGSFLRQRLEQLGLGDVTAETKFIPTEYFALEEDQICELLAGLWDTDGWVTDRQISICLKSESLARGIGVLLHRLGLFYSICKRRAFYRGDYPSYWVVTVLGESREKFVERVPTFKSNRYVGKVSNRGDLVPAWMVKEMALRIPADWKSYFDRARTSLELDLYWLVGSAVRRRDSNMARCNFMRIVRFFELEEFYHIEHLRFERIASVECVGEQDVYDCYVPGQENFVLNGCVVHNSQLAANIAWYMSFMQGLNVYIATAEMPVVQYRRRLVCRHSWHSKFGREFGLRMNDLKLGELSDGDEDFFRDVLVPDLQSSDGYGKLLIEQTPGATIEEVQIATETINLRIPLDVVVIDYLTLFRSARRYNDPRFELAEIFRSCKNFALAFGKGAGCLVLALHQINRSGRDKAEKSEEYTLMDLSLTAEAERSCDLSLWILRLESYVADHEVKCGVNKYRDGESGLTWRMYEDFASSYIGNMPVGAKDGSDVDF